MAAVAHCTVYSVMGLYRFFTPKDVVKQQGPVLRITGRSQDNVQLQHHTDTIRQLNEEFNDKTERGNEKMPNSFRVNIRGQSQSKPCQ
jgi:hypothetical protein